MVTLQALLDSRDARHAMQLQLLAANPRLTLVCATVVVPGSVKRNRQSLTVAHAAVAAMRQAFGQGDGREVPAIVERDLPTGYEAYLLTPLPLLEAKRLAVQIEDRHPLGRLFDIDIIDRQGMPVPRTDVGAQPRRCLVCSREARICMRMRCHTQEEIWASINALVDNWHANQP